jgi:hypothetical protein
LIAGSYTLSVAANADHTGSYSFRLSDLSSATTVSPGTAVSDSLNPGNATNLYRFSANAGDTFSFNAQSVTGGGNTYWRLLDPYGQQVWFQGFSTVASSVLALTGTYTLLVEGYVFNTSPVNYSFNYQAIQSLTNTAGLTLGSTVSGALTQAGQQNFYTFTLANASQLYFDALTNDGSFTWSLSGPRGAEISLRSFTGSDAGNFGTTPVIALAAGNYTLSIAGSNQHTGSYSFRLLDLAAATPITPGATVTGSLGDPALAAAQTRVVSTAPITYASGTNGAVQFTGNNIYLTAADSASLKPTQITLEAWVYADPRMSNYGGVVMKSTNSSWSDGYGLARYPDGTIDFFVNNYSSASVGTALPTGVWTHVAGTYNGSVLQLYLNGSLVASKAYSTPINNVTAPLRIGSGSGDYPWIGIIDDVRVWNTARAASDIAAGTYSNTFGNSGTLTLQLSGTYTVLFEGQIGATSAINYTFNVSSQGHVTVNPPTGTALTLGAVTSGAIATAGQQISYVFTIAGPANLYFDSLTNNGNLNWSLTGPQGAVVSNRGFASSDDTNFGGSSPIINLVVAATYQLTVQGSGSSTGSYSFRLSDLASASALSPSTVVSGTLNPGNSSNLYQFSATAGDLFYFDALSQNSSFFDWRLIDPFGRQVWYQNFSDVGTQQLAFTGTYTARVAFRTIATEDGAEAYITVTSEEPIAAGRVNLASVSITPLHSGRHLDGLRKLHVHDVNGKLFAKPEKVRIRIDDVARTSSEMSGTEQDVDLLDRYSERDSSAPKIRVKIPAPEASTDNASSEGILTEDPAQDWADLRMPVRIAIGELPATDTDLVSKDLRHSRRWNLDWSTNNSATNFPEKVRIPFASLAQRADPSPNP